MPLQLLAVDAIGVDQSERLQRPLLAPTPDRRPADLQVGGYLFDSQHFIHRGLSATDETELSL